jgi:hypothetical protein
LSCPPFLLESSGGISFVHEAHLSKLEKPAGWVGADDMSAGVGFFFVFDLP